MICLFKSFKKYYQIFFWGMLSGDRLIVDFWDSTKFYQIFKCFLIKSDTKLCKSNWIYHFNYTSRSYMKTLNKIIILMIVYHLIFIY